MSDKKKVHPKEKTQLHPRNKHRGRYDFKTLSKETPELEKFVSINKYGDESINFFDAGAVKTLNKALLKHYYNVEHWNIPDGYLCPPIPGRADYIHNIADLLGNNGEAPTGKKIKCLDIGVGANCVYPIIGATVYGWSFVGTEVDSTAIHSAKNIINANPQLKELIEIRKQDNPKNIFYGVIKDEELYDVTICNPPFHASAEEAKKGSLRKLSSLHKKKVTEAKLNFGGVNQELWCKGGEKKFVRDMIRQSRQFSKSVLWFTTLVSKQSNLNSAYEALKNAKVFEYKTIEMGQGTKSSRIIAWTFKTKAQQESWRSKWTSRD